MGHHDIYWANRHAQQQLHTGVAWLVGYFNHQFNTVNPRASAMLTLKAKSFQFGLRGFPSLHFFFQLGLLDFVAFKNIAFFHRLAR